MINQEYLNRRLEDEGHYDILVTIEGLNDEAVHEGKLRLANYGVSHDRGETITVGSPEHINSYIDKMNNWRDQ